MSERDPSRPMPKSREFSPAEISNGVYGEAVKAWKADRREAGLPEREPPKASDYSPAEQRNGLLGEAQRDYEREVEGARAAHGARPAPARSPFADIFPGSPVHNPPSRSGGSSGSGGSSWASIFPGSPVHNPKK